MLFNLDKKAQALKMVAGLSQWMRNPDELNNVRAVAGSLRGTNLFAQSMAHLLSHPRFKALADERINFEKKWNYFNNIRTVIAISASLLFLVQLSLR